MIVWIAKEEPTNSPTLVKCLGEKGVVTDIEAGDYVFIGKGLKGNGVDGTVGLEHKKSGDLAECIVHSSRHLDQLRRMRTYYDEVGLLISDVIVPNPDNGLASTRLRSKEGKLEYRAVVPPSSPNATISYSRYQKHLYTLERCMGVRVYECGGQVLAAQKILLLADWWQTPLEKHSSWLVEYKPQTLIPFGNARASLVRRLAAELNGVGVVRSANVEQKVRELGISARNMMGWSEEQWMEVEGIGKVTAKGIVEELGRRVK